MKKRISLLCTRPDGHAGVVSSIIKSYQLFTIRGVFDDNIDDKISSYFNCKYFGAINEIFQYDKKELGGLFICCGENRIRKYLYEKFSLKDYNFPNIIHPTAVVSQNVVIGNGVFVGPNAVINNGTKIGNAVIINSNTTIEHDNNIFDYVNISPGCNTSGRVIIKSSSFLGTGVSIIPDVTIGENAIIGAGATVINDISDNSKCVGVPARYINQKD